MRKYFILFLLVLSTFLSATILNVPGSYHYISLAIIAAVDGDTVLVQPGNYNGVINFDGKAILVTSIYLFTNNEADIYHTRLQGNYSDASLISFINGEGEDTVLNGFTITNGGTPAQGGAIICTGSSPTFTNLRLIDNQATSGGAIFASSAFPTMINCLIASNTGGDYGGAIYLELGGITLQSCEFSENFCGGDDVTGRAGAIFSSESSINCTDTNFIGNSSQAHGGAIYLSYSSGDFYHCQFINNSALGNVGGMYFYNSTHLNVINCTFYGNTGADAGALRYFHNVALTDIPIILNTVCWNNSPSELTFSPDNLLNEIIIAYCDLEGGQEAIVTNDNVNITWLDGNIDANPLFISPDYNFFALQNDSPCIDTGMDYFEYNSIIYLDLADDEYIGAAPELGAAETDPDNPPVLAMFASNIAGGEAPLAVQFTDNSLGEIDEWQWDFDNDGEIDSGDQSPLWTYEEAGTYSVKLTIISGEQTDYSLMVDLIVVIPPSDNDDDFIAPAQAGITVFPNPFNPRTAINYNLQNDSEIQLAVYNIKGQLIEVLFEGTQSAGDHFCSWDAQDNVAGIYFFRLHTATEDYYQKAILLK